MPTIGWSKFALDHNTKEQGNSYTSLPLRKVCARVQDHWGKRKPGDGETGIDRKVLVPVPAWHFFCPPKANLVPGLPVRAEVVQRQDGEEFHIETFVTPEDAELHGALTFDNQSACSVDIVCYSAEALLENDGKRSTDCDWEIVCLLCKASDEAEPMTPLTMARNQLEKAGGTKSEYTAQEYAESVWFYANRGVKIRQPSKKEKS